MLELVWSNGSCPITNLFPGRKRFEVSARCVLASPQDMSTVYIPEGLGKLQRLVDNAFALLIVAQFRVSLYRDEVRDGGTER